MTGRFVNAERALRIGLVSEVVPGACLEVAGQALVDDMLATSSLGLRLTKEAIAANVNASLDEAIALEDRNQILCAMGGDVHEGLRAFIEKRPPRFGRHQPQTPCGRRGRASAGVARRADAVAAG